MQLANRLGRNAAGHRRDHAVLGNGDTATTRAEVLSHAHPPQRCHP
jgi:hypothetical protein